MLDDAGEVERVLTREVGLNIYDRTNDIDFAAGRKYREKTRDFWADVRADVRADWKDRLTEGATVTLRAKVDSKRLHEHLFGYAADVAEAGVYDPELGRACIEATHDALTAAPGEATASR